jgi:hypothetical protein
MDYTDPRNRRLRDEPTLPLSPEEAQIAAALYSATAYGKFAAWLNATTSTPNTTTHEEETDPRNN